MARKQKPRGFTYGATFDWAKIRAELNRSDWEESDEDPRVQIRRVWLGTVFGITPSGKFYMPFACSNVAGDCKACGGTGTHAPRTGHRARRRAARRAHAFSRGTLKRGTPWSQRIGVNGLTRYIAHVAPFRAKAYTATALTCHCCDGLGSASAARDERWREALEAAASAIDAYVDYHDDSIFVAESRDADVAAVDDAIDTSDGLSGEGVVDDHA